MYCEFLLFFSKQWLDFFYVLSILFEYLPQVGEGEGGGDKRREK